MLLGALHSPNEAIVQIALEKLDEQELYEKTACSEHGQMAEWALAKIGDSERKKELLLKMKSDYAFSNGLKQLIEEGWTPDEKMQGILLAKAGEAGFEKWSLPYVVQLLTSEQVLADVARTSSNRKARHAAIQSISDDAVLAEIAMNECEDILNRELAFGRLKNQELVDKKTTEYIRSVDSAYWSEAEKRMADIMSKDSY